MPGQTCSRAEMVSVLGSFWVQRCLRKVTLSPLLKHRLSHRISLSSLLSMEQSWKWAMPGLRLFLSPVVVPAMKFIQIETFSDYISKIPDFLLFFDLAKVHSR